MNRLIPALLALALSAAWVCSASAAPQPQYPFASTPFDPSADYVTGVQGGHTASFKVGDLSTTAQTVTGPYTGQVAQTLSGEYSPTCLSVLTYLSKDQQQAVRAGTSAVDFSPILTAAIASHPAIVQGTNPICLGLGIYPFQSTVHITRATLLTGAGGDGVGGFNYGTILVFPKDTTGLVIDTAASSGTTGGDGSVIQNLNIEAQTGGTSTTAYGIWMRGKSTIRNVSVGGFAQDQVHIEACGGCGGVLEGNDNGFLVDQLSVAGNAPLFSSTAVGVNGLVIQGADTNAGTTINVNASNLKGWGIYDNAFLNGQNISPEAATTGLLSRVNYLGTSYWANPATTSSLLGSTTPGTNTAVWTAIAAGSYPTWTNGGTYYPGGPFSSPGVTQRITWTNPYAETGDPPSYGNQNSQVIGGLVAPGWVGNVALQYNNLGVLTISNTPLATVEVTSGGETQTVTMGGLDIHQNATGKILSYNAATNWPSTLSFGTGGATGHDLAWVYPTGHIYEFFTGPNTVNTFGRSAIDPYANLIPSLVIADKTQTGANGRHLNTCNAAPSTTGNAVGEVCLNYAAAPGVPMGWVETAQGSPDTWVPLAVIPVPPAAYGSLTTCNSTTKYATSFATDASSATYSVGAVVTGGGSNVVKVYCNGSSWVAGKNDRVDPRSATRALAANDDGIEQRRAA